MVPIFDLYCLSFLCFNISLCDLTVEDVRHSAQEMDETRKKNVVYEYLCHLEEAKM